MRTGADLKVGFGPNLTLDATVNPDFGQVDADPAEVNLSAFETFFSERRPFFTEGSQLLSGGGAGYFYSRRIGAAPHGFADGDFVDTPTSSTILGAAKLTGRLPLRHRSASGRAHRGEHARTVDVEADTFGRVRVERRRRTAWCGCSRAGEARPDGGLHLTGVHRPWRWARRFPRANRAGTVTGAVDWALRWAGAYEVSGALGFSPGRRLALHPPPAALQRATSSAPTRTT